ncbi:MAG: thermonuclease family protein [Rhodospirillaceae bacterium]
MTAPRRALPPLLTLALAAALLTAATDPSALAQQRPQPSQTPPVPRQNPTVAGPGVAMTGDLLTVGGNSVRLSGIAAPVAGETCQTRYGALYDCYRKSTDVLQALVGDKEVSCEITATDRTGQKIGVCRIGTTDLAAAMVARGWAFAYRRLSPAYVSSEAFAESHRLGMWAGRVETPWQWKTRKLSDTVR